MTLQDLIELEKGNQWLLIAILGGIPVLALLNGLLGGRNVDKGFHKYFYSVLVYAGAIPGMLSLAACIHLFFIDDGDFLNANLLIYFAPIVSMVVTLSIINQYLPLRKVPGFGRISGLLMVAGIVGLVLFFLKRTFIGVIFFGSIWTLVGFFAILVVVFGVGSQMLLGKKKG